MKGVFRDPKVFLAAGDEVAVEIEALASRANPCTERLALPRSRKSRQVA